MTTLADPRTRLRKDLHDEDATNYRWTDGELDHHIQHTVREFSLAVPLEAKSALATTAGSRDLSISGLTDMVAIEAVEYPAGEFPPSYARYSVWLSTLITSTLFGLGHYDSLSVIVASFLLGIACAIVFEISQSIWTSILLHATTNCIAFGLMFLAMWLKL